VEKVLLQYLKIIWNDNRDVHYLGDAPFMISMWEDSLRCGFA